MEELNMAHKTIAVMCFATAALCSLPKVSLAQRSATPSNFATAASEPDTSLSTPPKAGPNRPANVPDGYVITPFGYFHPSCVRNLAEGERLLTDGRVQHADGRLDQEAAVCTYPHFTSAGALLNPTIENKTSQRSSNATTTPEFNGWLENANITTGSPTTSYGAMFAMWTVPPQPSANDGQVLYFFPGFEDINDSQTSILQPVLGWYEGQWSVASWNCCLSGIITNSPGVIVAPGDEIYGSVTSTCAAGTLSCATWNVLSLDLSTGDSTTLSDTPSDGQIFNWAFGGVLEVYYVVGCDDFPTNGKLSFDKITVFNQNLEALSTTHWAEGVNTTTPPQCGYSVIREGHEVTLHY
jgi:hypothetical protein